MLRRPIVATVCTIIFCTSFGVPFVHAADEERPALYKAYYLEHQAKDYRAARALYDGLLGDKVSDDIKTAARTGSGRCRDSIAAENLAALMPENTLVYVEVKRPGRLLEQFAGMLGLTGKDVRALLAQRPNTESQAPFYVPPEVVISPALFEAFDGLGSVAVAMTSFDPHGAPPTGVMVFHHGDTKLLRGLIETAFQFSPTAEKVADLPTFGAEVPEIGRVTGVLTEGLFIVGTGRDLVEGVVQRLLGKESASLAARKDLAEVMARRGESALFAYVNLQSVLERVRKDLSEADQREFAIADAFCDLSSLRWATFTAGIDQGALGAELTVRLADDHHSLVYNLMRLPPMNRRSLECVPPDAAGLIGFGLNPTLALAAADAAGGREQPGGCCGKTACCGPADAAGVTGLDLGREIFGNIQEVCAYVIPGEMIRPRGKKGPPMIPNAALIMAVNDPARSRVLWETLLSIPGKAMKGGASAPKKTRIGETEVTAFSIPDFGKVYLADLEGCVVVATSRSAMKASIRARGTKESILKDEALGKVIAGMPADTSFMAVGHVGRLVKVGAGAGGNNPLAAMGANQAAEICDKMIGWISLAQSPNQMTLRAALSGLPDVNVALRKFGPMINMASMFARPQTAEQPKAVRRGARSRGEAGERSTAEQSPRPPRPLKTPKPASPEKPKPPAERRPADQPV